MKKSVSSTRITNRRTRSGISTTARTSSTATTLRLTGRATPPRVTRHPMTRIRRGSSTRRPSACPRQQRRKSSRNGRKPIERGRRSRSNLWAARSRCWSTERRWRPKLLKWRRPWRSWTASTACASLPRRRATPTRRRVRDGTFRTSLRARGRRAWLPGIFQRALRLPRGRATLMSDGGFSEPELRYFDKNGRSLGTLGAYAVSAPPLHCGKHTDCLLSRRSR